MSECIDSNIFCDSVRPEAPPPSDACINDWVAGAANEADAKYFERFRYPICRDLPLLGEVARTARQRTFAVQFLFAFHAGCVIEGSEIQKKQPPISRNMARRINFLAGIYDCADDVGDAASNVVSTAERVVARSTMPIRATDIERLVLGALASLGISENIESEKFLWFWRDLLFLWEASAFATEQAFCLDSLIAQHYGKSANFALAQKCVGRPLNPYLTSRMKYLAQVSSPDGRLLSPLA